MSILVDRGFHMDMNTRYLLLLIPFLGCICLHLPYIHTPSSRVSTFRLGIEASFCSLGLQFEHL